MQKLVIHIFGKIKDPSVVDLVEKYLSLTNHYIKTEIKIHKDRPEQPINQEQLTGIRKPHIILTESGKQYSSLDFSKYISKQIENYGELNFILGNAFGFAAEIINNNKENLALASMTFTHELSLVILLEQLYRALNIRAGGKYHK